MPTGVYKRKKSTAAKKMLKRKPGPLIGNERELVRLGKQTDIPLNVIPQRLPNLRKPKVPRLPNLRGDLRRIFIYEMIAVLRDALNVVQR